MTRILRDLSFIMAGVLTLAMISATVVEKFLGHAVADHYIYGAPWTVGAWCVMAVAAAAYIVRQRRSMSVPTLLIHASFGLILAGAAVTHFCGVSGTVNLSSDRPAASSFTSDSGHTCPLPFELRFEDCRVEYYPGTRTPSDYVSEISAEGHPMTVAMNRVGSWRGYRFFQTAMGPGRSTTLSVQHDPWGIGISYAGYAMLVVSMGAFMLSSRTRRRGRAAILTALCLIPAAAQAQPRAPQRAVAAMAGTLMVNYNGRIAPLSTLAREFCLKVHGSDSYEGLTAEQVACGWLFYYEDWKNEPFIKIKDHNVADALGIRGRYAALTDFYSPTGYKLQDESPSAAILEANEKSALVSGICTGAAFRIFPCRTASGETTDWISWVDRRPADMSLDDWKFVQGSMEYVARELAHGRDTEAWEALISIRDRQRVMAGETAPSEAKIRAEIFYGRHCGPLPAVILAIAAGIGALFMRGRPARLTAHVTSWLLLAFLTAAIGLRWWLSGHLPLANGFETMQAMAWCAAAVAASARKPLLPPLALIVCGLSLTVSMMGEHNPAITPLMPVLASPLLSIHVAMIMTAYALLAIVAVNSAIAFFTRDRSRTGLSLRLLRPGVFLLAAGIFIGAVWANQSWGRYWGWDPKETWALVTMAVYALPMHGRSWPCFRRPRVTDAYLALAFVSVLITYFGVNFLLGGLHSYATS